MMAAQPAPCVTAPCPPPLPEALRLLLELERRQLIARLKLVERLLVLDTAAE